MVYFSSRSSFVATIIMIHIHCMLFQIENEYGVQSKMLGPAGYNYMSWAAKMAVEMGTGVPWIMCKEDDAPDPVVSILILPLKSY